MNLVHETFKVNSKILSPGLRFILMCAKIRSYGSLLIQSLREVGPQGTDYLS